MSFETLVLDNDSGDGTVEMVQSEFPGRRSSRSNENIGFAAGVNRLAEGATGRVRAPAEPGHGRAPARHREPRGIRARGAPARHLRRAHGEPGRLGPPGVVLGQADALEPDVLRDDALDGVQGLGRLRPRVPRLVAARLRSRGRHRDRLPPARSRLRLEGARRLRPALLHVRRGRRSRAARRRARLLGPRSRRTP